MIQYTADMIQSDIIISINIDEDAEILKQSYYAIVGDLYEIFPDLIERIKGGQA